MRILVAQRAVNVNDLLYGVEVDSNVLHEVGVLESRRVPGLCVDGGNKGDEFEAIGFDGFGNGEDKVPWIGCRYFLSRVWLVVVNE